MLTDKQFFEKIKPMVIADYHSSKILASLTAAQAFLESRYGNSTLTIKANNLFGINIYPQQLLSVISLLFTIVIIVYLLTVIRKIPNKKNNK